jgi:hypothetical protein
VIAAAKSALSSVLQRRKSEAQPSSPTKHHHALRASHMVRLSAIAPFVPDDWSDLPANMKRQVLAEVVEYVLTGDSEPDRTNVGEGFGSNTSGKYPSVVGGNVPRLFAVRTCVV